MRAVQARATAFAASVPLLRRGRPGAGRSGVSMSGLTFVYVAISEAYVREALQAAAKCRSVVPGCRVLLYTDADVQDPSIDGVLHAHYRGEDPFLMKIRGMRVVQEERFIFLDTDTWIVADISEIGR